MSEKFERDWNLRQVDGGVVAGDILGEILRRGTRVIQEELELKVDGLAGPATVSALEDELGLNTASRKLPSSRLRKLPDIIPIPTKRGIETVYGSFKYEEHPSKPGAIVIERPWVKKNIVRVVLHTGQYTYCHRLIADEFRRLYERACDSSGYTPKKVWSWVARFKRWHPTGKHGISDHSWGIAFDVDPKLNAPGKEDTPLHRHPEFAAVFRQAGWECGIDWKKYPDPMHFSRVRR